MTQHQLTLGSLFDGIGGFPFAGEIAGIKPVWAAEVEPLCVAVTKHRFPDMLHFGDVSKLNGADLPPVDIITFGSPCQDLSVAGQRKGLKHKKNGDGETTRSGLFFEAVRIIYEMREATNGQYPTFIVWENVPGAFTSHSGRDFRTVLEEITQTDIPMPRSGKWANAGVVRSERIHAAWRVLDAQYWGVPQRRKRIFLVGSFGTDCAEKISFNRDSVRGYLTPSRGTRKYTETDIRKCTQKRDSACGVNTVVFDARGNGDGNTAPTITGDHNGHISDYTAVVAQGVDLYNQTLTGDKAMTVRAKNQSCDHIPCVVYSAGFQGQNSITAGGVSYEVEKSATLRASVIPSTVYAIDRAAFNQGKNAKYDFEITENGINPTLVAKGPSAVCYNIGADQSIGMLPDNPYSGIYETDVTRTLDGNGGNPACNQGVTVIVQELIDWIVRRLTPRECERLQGYPDDWTVLPKINDMSEADYLFFRDVFCTYRAINGKRVKKLPTKEQIIKWYNKLDKDSPRYRALGNSLAIPCALRVLDGIAEVWKEQQNDRHIKIPRSEMAYCGLDY